MENSTAKTESQLTLVSNSKEVGDLRSKTDSINDSNTNPNGDRNVTGHSIDDINSYLCRGCSHKDISILYLPEEKYIRRLKPEPGKTSIKEWLERRINGRTTLKLLKKRFPIASWLPGYDVSSGFSDFVAGTTVGLMVIPQAIALSNVAGLPSEIGLYSSFLACFAYAIFGSVKDAAIGPTAISGLLARENNHGFGVDGAVVLCFLTGCVQLLMGLFQLGFLIDFISGPVSIGFTSAAAIIIATTQIKNIFGLTFSANTFLENWENIFEHIGETRLWDTVLGISCMIVILLLRKSKDFRIGSKTAFGRGLEKVIWLISISRNIIVVVISATIAYFLEAKGKSAFDLIGFVKPGLPEFKVPPFSARIGNETYSFIEMSTAMGSGIIVTPLLGILESIALAKVFSEGKSIDATQEMLALGVCNVASSFVCAMPVSGALSRGAVNNASGVKTPFGGVYTGLIVLLSLHFFTPYFHYIPKASLAAVIVAAVVFMVELHVIKPIWRTKKTDLIPAAITFLGCLFFRLEIGMAIGIGLNLISLLYASARPSIHVDKVTGSICDYLVITPDRSLTFPSVEYVRSIVTKAGVKDGSSQIPVIIDARHIQGADFTAAKGIKLLIDDFIKRNQALIFYNLKPTVVMTIKGVKPREFVHCSNHFELDEVLKKYSTLSPE